MPALPPIRSRTWSPSRAAAFPRLGLTGVVQDLGLPADVARTHVGFMGCHGALNGLRVAEAFAKSDQRACVLVCAVELCSLHHQYDWQPEQIVANSLFGDGAASIVVCSAAPFAPPGKSSSCGLSRDPPDR